MTTATSLHHTALDLEKRTDRATATWVTNRGWLIDLMNLADLANNKKNALTRH